MYLRYYEQPAVQARIRDFLGGREATCMYLLVREGGTTRSERVLPEALDEALSRNSEVERSLWDREALVAHLDLEYVNFDAPLSPYMDPTRSFALQAPAAGAVQEVLLEDGIAPLHLLSGRGHHFAWTIARGSEAWSRLEALGKEWVPPSLLELYQSPCAPTEEAVGEEAGAAYAGLGLVMELVAHRVLERAAARCRVPLLVTALEVGPGERGREIVSLDLSEYGDPLHCRTVRVPFGAYLKTDYLVHPGVKEALPPMVVLPLHEMSEAEGLLAMRDLERAADLASHVPSAIPDLSRAMGSLLDRYEASELRRFHLWYRHEGRPGRVPEGPLPRCVQEILDHPNDRLLKPAGVQLALRALLADGFHPREAAGAVLERLQDDHDWIPGVHFCDAAVRAEFYARLFTGLFVGGRDDLVDFNCRSTQEKGYCPVHVCSSNLAHLRDALAERRSRGRLAGGPFHGMLLRD